ncbi:MAG TPA: bestrophin family ion channel [Pyrinomonadaceae bacterium]|jgi:putative membrane protein
MIEYDSHKWASHLFVIRGSIIGQIFWRLVLFAAWCAAVVAVHNYVLHIGMPSTVHTLVGVALGLLLVFRTNCSYDRFWEGRKLWGGIVNESRNLATSAHAYLGNNHPLVEPIILWTSTFSYASMHTLRGTAGLGPAAERLPASEVEAVLAAKHIPSAVALRIRRLLAGAQAAGHLNYNNTVAIDNNVQQLIDYIGGCERILKTPLPFAYVVHLRRALVLYCLTIPFALVETFGWFTCIVTLLVGYILFGIEEIGVEIEDPFGDDANDLPLEQICGNIERNVLAVLDDVSTANSVGGDGAIVNVSST